MGAHNSESEMMGMMPWEPFDTQDNGGDKLRRRRVGAESRRRDV